VGSRLKRSEIKRGRSKKKVAYDRELDALTPELLKRAEFACEVRIPGACREGRSAAKLTRHHRLPRGQGGQNTMENVIVVCGDGVAGCHGHIEHNRTEAYEKGWLVHMGQDPADVPWERA
jgi:hypothetical protein